MPEAANREQFSSEELRELSLTGPFGGIQSELPPTLLTDYGFQDAINILFRKGAAYARPTYSTLPAIASQKAQLVFANYWSRFGNRAQLYITNIAGGSVPYRWTGAAWQSLTGPVLADNSSPFATAVLNGKLCFSRNVPPEQLYIHDFDTSQNTYVLAAAGSPAALNLAEIGLHLMASNTVEGGVIRPQRYHWSGVGDPTDWVSFSSGFNDNLNDLGPATGLIKLGQYGFGFHSNGLIQIVPTGIGFAPFAFYPIVGTNGGCGQPYSIAKVTVNDIESAVYVGDDNIYLFNQTSVTSIGDAPIGNRRRIGARSKIKQDITQSSNSGFSSNVRGYVSYSINGIAFNAYWLVIPNAVTNPTAGVIWVYNFDEDNWTRLIFDRIPTLIGQFANLSTTFVSFTPEFDDVALAFSDGTLARLNFSFAGSETSTTIQSGKYILADRRHKHTIKKFRLAFLDLGAVTFTLTITNESGVSQQQTFTLGTGSNDELTFILSFNITGLRLQYTLTAPSGSQFGVTELCPMFSTSGEQRGGTVDGN